MKKIAIFASGSGTNAENIIMYASKVKTFEVTKIYCNKPHAGIIERAYKLDVPVVVFNRKTFYETETLLDDMKNDNVDLVVLAGFLWLVPGNILKHYSNRIINIHPALLPKFGGKGMYGAKVHEAVVEAGEKESGITIHLVNEEYDRGEILFQASCPVERDDTPDSLAHKIHDLEYRYFPGEVETFLKKL